MNIDRIASAWRDEEYFLGLDAGQKATLPESPIGEIDLTDIELADVDAGAAVRPQTTWLCATVTLVTALYCLSALGGGTCTENSLGCC